jgi:hypothetical protein
MITLTLKPQHQDSVIGQLLSLKSKLDYHKNEIAPNLYQLKDWEKKEYATVDYDNQLEFDCLKQYIIENQGVFNSLLNSYNLSVAIFVNKFLL